MKRINVWRGQAPRGIRTVNTTGFGGIVLVPTILMVLLLGAVLIACPEAGSSGGGGSQATVETTAKANVITAKWQASAGASGYTVKVTDDKGAVVFSKVVASETDKKEYELDIPLSGGKYTIIVFTKEKPDTAIATSNAIEITTAATPPEQPAITENNAVERDISITWTAPAAGKAHNGDDATIKGYTIYWKQGATVDEHTNNDGHKPVAKTADSTTLTVADDKLLGVTKYAIIVVAENTAGLRTASDLVLRNTASQAVAPGAPQDVDVVEEPTSTSITVTWKAPATLGKTKEGNDAEITGYTVYYKAGTTTITGDDITKKNVESVESTATTVTLSGLLGATKYAIAVRAKNSDDAKNSGDMSSTSEVITSTTLSGATAPGQITDLVVAASEAGTVELKWTTPTAGKVAKGTDATITKYLVYYKKYTGTTAPTTLTPGDTDEQIHEAGSVGTSKSITVHSLDPSTNYVFAVKVRNDAGKESTASNIVSATTKVGPTPPKQTTGLNATQSDATSSVVVSWTAPTDAGKAANGKDAATLNHYTLYYRKATEAESVTGAVIEFGATTAQGVNESPNLATTITDTSFGIGSGVGALEANQGYIFVIESTNSENKTSVLSKVAYIKTLSQATAPSAVSGITTALGTVANNTQPITVEWAIPTEAKHYGTNHKGATATIESYTLYYKSQYLWNDAENKAQKADELTITQAEITALKADPNAQTAIKPLTILKKDLKKTTGTPQKYSHTFDAMTYSSYVFVIVARNNVDLDSSIASTIPAAQKATTATASAQPGKITEVTATAGKADKTASSNNITLTWKVTDTGKTHKGETAELVQYTIYWKEGTSIPTDLSTIPSNNIVTLDKSAANATTHTISGLNKKTEYAFAIRATNNAGLKSDVSDTAKATTADAPPQPKELWAYGTTVTIVFDEALQATDNTKFTVTQGSTTPYTVKSAVLATDRVHLTLAKTLSGGEEITVVIEAGAVTGSTNNSNDADSKTGIVMGAVYKADNSEHQGKFSLGDYNDPGLFKLVELPGGSKPWYEIKVSAGSTSIYTLAKQQITEAVPSSGENKGSTYVGLAMDATTAAKWRGITVGSEVTITLTVYDDAGTTEFFSETVTPKKSQNGSIYSWRGLQNMQDDLGGDYKLENDIEFPEPNTKGFKKFTPVGASATSAFTGTLDGNNKKVSKLYIDHDADNVGLFGSVKAKTKDSVVVKDLILEDPTVTSKKGNVGALIGQNNIGMVSNVHVRGDTGAVSGNDNVGGLVGHNTLTGTVTGYATGAVSGNDNVGGLVGSNKGTVRGYATGAVSAGAVSGGRDDYIGGLVGYNSGTVTGYATGAVSSITGTVGGLVGTNYNGTVTGYATGTVSGASYVGGLVGSNEGDEGGTVTGYATGTVSGNQLVGGLVGSTYGTVTGYALGYVIKRIAGKANVGPGIGKTLGGTENVYVGRTSEEAGKTAGAGDHVGVIATTKPTSATKSNGAAPQGIVIEGSGRNVAADSTKTPPIVAKLYSKNEDSFSLFDFGTAEGEWTLGANDWPILNFASDFADGARTQNPSIPTKPENFHE